LGRKWMYIIIAAVLVVILAIGGTVYYVGSGNYAAKIDGQKITKAEYQFFVSSIKQQLANNYGITDMKQKIQNKTAGDTVREGALESATEYKIQLIKAKEANVKLTSDEEKSIDTNFDANVIQQSGSKLEADKKIKAELGISLEDYKAIYKGYYLTQKFRSEEMKKIKVSDEDAKKYFTESMRNAEKETTWHILIKTVDAENKELPADKVKEAEKKANEVLEKVKAGEKFADLVNQYSEDEGSKSTGGEYTGYPKGQMVAEFEKWAFESKDGDVGIVKTKFGFHVMKKPTFDDVKEEAKAGMVSKKYSEQMDKWKKDPLFKVVKNDAVINSIKL
jgi:foldase protein PrsA